MGNNNIAIFLSFLIIGSLVYFLCFMSSEGRLYSTTHLRNIDESDIVLDTVDTTKPQLKSHLPPASARVLFTILEIGDSKSIPTTVRVRINEVLEYGPYTEVIGVGQELTIHLSSSHSANKNLLEAIKPGREYKAVINLVRIPISQASDETHNWVFNKIEKS